MKDASAVTTLAVPYNRPYTTGSELTYIEEAVEGSHLSGNGPFSRRCTNFLEELLAVLLKKNKVRGVLDQNIALQRRVNELTDQTFAVLLKRPSIEISADHEGGCVYVGGVPQGPARRLRCAILILQIFGFRLPACSSFPRSSFCLCVSVYPDNALQQRNFLGNFLGKTGFTWLDQGMVHLKKPATCLHFNSSCKSAIMKRYVRLAWHGDNRPGLQEKNHGGNCHDHTS